MLVSVLYYSNNVCLWKEIENLVGQKEKKENHWFQNWKECFEVHLELFQSYDKSPLFCLLKIIKLELFKGKLQI